MPAFRPPFLRLSLLLGLAAGGLPLAAQTDPALQPGRRIQLQLANGDRLTGELIWRADGKLRFRSAVLGDLTVSEPDVAVLPVPEALDPAVTGDPAPPLVAKPAPASASPASGRRAARPAPERWKGKVELGHVQQTGRTDTLSYNARAEAEKSVRRHSLRAHARVLYAEQNDQPGADRTDASFRWRYQLTKRAFSQAQTTYYRDNVTEIDTNLEQNLGLGYRIVDRSRHTVNVGAGATAQYRDWSAGTNGFAPYAEFFEDYVFRINERVTFNQDLVAQYSPSDRAFNLPSSSQPGTVDPEQQNYKVRFNSALQGKVTERISVNLRFEYELDNAIQLDAARESQRVTSSIGYAF
jgi:putative salt-induced outer membrane protein YdiY